MMDTFLEIAWINHKPILHGILEGSQIEITLSNTECNDYYDLLEKQQAEMYEFLSKMVENHE